MDKSFKPKVFTDQEVKRYRADINSVRTPGAYEPGKWSVSPLNRDPAITGVMPAHVRLRDITLRAIESMPGVVITAERKRAFLLQLVRAGVTEIVTAPARSRPVADLRADLDMIKSEDARVRTTCPLIFHEKDLNAPAEAGYDAVQIWAQPWGEASRMYEGGVHATAWSGGNWRDADIPADRDGFITRAAGLIERARDLGLRVTAPMLMVSFLNDKRIEQTVRTLADAGANEIALFDGPGGMSPEALAHVVAAAKQTAPDVEIGVHPHNSFGMAVACAVSAAKAGADVIEVSVNGYCGGPGNADLAVAAAAFEALYGVPTGIRHEHLKGLSQLGAALTGYHTAYNHPITGDKVYNWGGMDFMTQELEIDELLHNSISPAWSGSDIEIPLTEASGPFTLWDKLDMLGLSAMPTQVDAILVRCKAEMTRIQGLLSDTEIVDIALSAGATRSASVAR